MSTGSIGDFKMPKKKFRWLMEFFNDGVSVSKPQFVKITARPPAAILYPEETKFDMKFDNLWLPKGSALAPFNEVLLKLVMGDEVFEEWYLTGAKIFYLINDALDDEEVFAGTFSYTTIKYKCLKKL